MSGAGAGAAVGAGAGAGVSGIDASCCWTDLNRQCQSSGLQVRKDVRRNLSYPKELKCS